LKRLSKNSLEKLLIKRSLLQSTFEVKDEEFNPENTLMILRISSETHGISLMKRDKEIPFTIKKKGS